MDDSINLDDIIRIEISRKEITEDNGDSYEQRMINCHRKGGSFTRIFVGGPNVTIFDERAESLFKEGG